MIPRLALLGALLASSLGLAHSTKFNFPTCVDECVGSNGCGSNNAKCMCRAANNGNFLVQVVGCMSRRCDDGVGNVDGDFLDVITRGCNVARMPISGDRIQAAESAADNLRNPPSPPNTQPPPVQTTPPTSPKQPPATQPPPIRTTAQQPPPSIIPTLSEEPPVSITRRPGDEPTGGSVFTITRTDGPIVPTTAATNPPPSEPTDSSPFAVPNTASGATVAWMGAWVPLVALWGLM